MTSIESILRKNGPLISSELAKLLSKREKITINTASQRVARNAEISQIKGFFKSNQSLCFLPDHKNHNVLVERLIDAMYESGRKYWYTVNAIKMNEGVIGRTYLECYTNYPIIPLKGHIPFDNVMEKFVSQKILVSNNTDYQFSPDFSKMVTNPLLHRTIELIKDNILSDFNTLARNIGLVSYNTGTIFGEFAKFRWGYKGVSPIMGLREKNKFGFLLADIILGRPFYKQDVLFFIEKIKHVQSFKNASKLFPILLVDNLDTEALTFLKSKGIVVGFLKELFGEKYATAINELITILNNAGASLKADPDKYLDLIHELKKYNEGLANNIKGTLFEFVIGHFHRLKCQSLDIGREIISDIGRVDIDVLALYSDKTVFAECKAYKALVNEEIVDVWITKSIPAMRKWALGQDRLKDYLMEFEFWSISGFTEQALKDLQVAKEKTKAYQIGFFGPNELRDTALKTKNKKLKEAIDNFFLKPTV
ncbi:MAG TPA: hypothetical protein VGG71_08240 [Chitinophagaceae bacterium]|jgi:hypothetical protein